MVIRKVDAPSVSRAPAPSSPSTARPLEDRLARAGVPAAERRELVRSMRSAAKEQVAELREAVSAQKPGEAVRALLEKKSRTGEFSAFVPHRRHPVDLGGHRGGKDACGRGTNDDSIGRGTNDDSIGRGTNDDSIGSAGEDAGRDVGNEALTGAATQKLAINVRGLKGPAKAQLEALLTKDMPHAQHEALEYALKSKTFNSLGAAQRTELIELLSSTNERGTKLVARMMEEPAVFKARASDGSTVVKNLARLARSGDQHVLNSVLADVVNPARIWQGNAPTCTVASMQYDLAKQNPAEYTRLLAGLAVRGEVTMQGGGTLTRHPKTSLKFEDLKRQDRSASEALFQDAAMEFANGSAKYDPSAYRGLKADQITRMVGELYGVEYKTKLLDNDREALTEAKRIRLREGVGKPVLFDIDFGSYNHCVSFEGEKNGNVFYRDPETGKVETMSVAEFAKRAVAVHYAVPPAPDAVVEPYVG